jgi:hypothetical protein
MKRQVLSKKNFLHWFLSDYTEHPHVETHLSSRTPLALGDTPHQTALRCDDPHKKKHLDTTTTYRLNADSTCQLE